MKKIVFLSLFMATILQVGQAQISIGAVVGVNYSDYVIDFDMTDVDFPSAEMDLGYFIGATSSVELGEKFNVLADLKYAIRGYSYPNPDANFTFKYRVNYFEVVPKIEFRPVEFIGIAAGINFGVYAGGSLRQGNEDWQNFANELDLFDANLALSGSVRGYLNNFFIEAGYEHSIKNVSEINFTNSNGESLGTTNSYFRNFNLGLGYLLVL